MAIPLELVPLHFEPENRSVSPELEAYDQIALFANPLKRYKATRKYHYEQLLVRGNEHGFRITNHDTAPNIEASIDLLENVGETSLIAIVGGDGSASTLMHAAYKLGIENPFMILNGGNAINQARMHHNSRRLNRPDRILLSGRIRQVFPIQDRAEYPDGTVKDTLAFAYSTRGYTALATAGLTAPEHRLKVEGASRAKRASEELKVALESRDKIVPFEVHREGKPSRSVVELAYVSGKLMAKYLRFPADLFEKECVIVEAADVRYRTIGKTALGLAIPGARRRHAWLKANQEHSFQLSTHDGSDIHVEHDGEARSDPSGTFYRLSIANKSVNVVTS